MCSQAPPGLDIEPVNRPEIDSNSDSLTDLKILWSAKYQQNSLRSTQHHQPFVSQVLHRFDDSHRIRLGLIRQPHVARPDPKTRR